MSAMEKWMRNYYFFSQCENKGESHEIARQYFQNKNEIVFQ